MACAPCRLTGRVSPTGASSCDFTPICANKSSTVLGRDVFRWKGLLEPGTRRVLWFYAMPPTGAAGLWEHTQWPGCGPGPLRAGVWCTQRSPPPAHLLTKAASSRGASFVPGWLSRKLSQLVSHCHCGAGPVPEHTLRPRPPADRHQRMGAGASQI